MDHAAHRAYDHGESLEFIRERTSSQEAFFTRLLLHVWQQSSEVEGLTVFVVLEIAVFEEAMTSFEIHSITCLQWKGPFSEPQGQPIPSIKSV